METRKILGFDVPVPFIVLGVLVLAGVGYLIAGIGGGGGSTTTSVDATVTPRAIGLASGQTRQLTVIIKNPADAGMAVSSISAGSSRAAGGCSAGAVTSEEVNNPTGFIAPNGINAFSITVKGADNLDDRCLSQSLTIPLTAELVSSGG